MKICLRLFAALSVMAALASCEVPDDNPDNQNPGAEENEGTINGGDGQGEGGVVIRDKKIQHITRSWVTEHRKMLNEVNGLGTDGEDSDVDAGVDYLKMTYDEAGRIAAIHQKMENWQLNYSFDYNVNGEIRATRWRAGGPDWLDPLLYIRLTLDGKGNATSYWQSTTSPFLDMNNFEKMYEFSYSEDGVLTSLSDRGLVADFVYTDGMLTSLVAGEEVSDFYSWTLDDYANRYPAKGNMPAVILFMTMIEEEFEHPFVFVSLIGCMGKVGDSLLEKTDNLEVFAVPEVNLKYDIPNEVYHHTSYYVSALDEMAYTYKFDTEGYVTEWNISKGFNIVKKDYDIYVGNEWDGDSYNYEKRNVTETVVDSGVDTVSYKVEYL